MTKQSTEKRTTDRTPSSNRSVASWRWALACAIGTVALMMLAAAELRRVEEGQLFAFALPWDAAPSEVELADAKMSASTNKLAAVISVALIGFLFAGAALRTVNPSQTNFFNSRLIITLFVLAVMADLATTICFFHTAGIEHELHPGIRLFGYAYGRTTGPIAGKAIQAAGVLAMASIMRRYGSWLLIGAAAIYSIAALYNFAQIV